MVICATPRNNAALREIEDLGLSLHVESRDGQQRLVALDRRHQRRFAVTINDGREDAAADHLLSVIQSSRN